MQLRPAWLVAILGTAAAALGLLRRRRFGAQPAPEPAVNDHADELRRRLAESRALAGDREEHEEGEVPVDRIDASRPDAEELRRDVRARGRDVARKMRDSAGPEG